MLVYFISQLCVYSILEVSSIDSIRHSSLSSMRIGRWISHHFSSYSWSISLDESYRQSWFHLYSFSRVSLSLQLLRRSWSWVFLERSSSSEWLSSIGSQGISRRSRPISWCESKGPIFKRWIFSEKQKPISQAPSNLMDIIIAYLLSLFLSFFSYYFHPYKGIWAKFSECFRHNQIIKHWGRWSCNFCP